MARLIDEFLKKHGSNRYQVAKISGIGESTLAGANNAPLNNVTVKTLQSLGMATGISAGDVLNELIELEIALESDPVVSFIQAHPYMDKKLVQEVTDKMIESKWSGANLRAVMFRYYDEVEDTNENAEITLRNLLDGLGNVQNVISKTKK